MTRTMFAVLTLSALAGAAAADIVAEDSRFGGSIITDIYGNLQDATPRGGNVVYSNTSSAANAATSSSNLNTRWGDRLNMTGTGVLQDFSFTMFNSTSGGNTGSLLTAQVELRFYRQSDSSLIGGFSGNVNFGTGLNAGFFSTITFTNLAGLGIDLDTANIFVTQQRLSHTGATTRLGIASLSPVTIGTSPVDFYRDDPSAPPAGFYVFSGGAVPADLGYQVVVPTPAGASLLGLGGLLAARRRR